MENPFLKSDFGKGVIMHLNKPHAPTLACVYAFEMSDSTVKIGVSEDADRRKGEVQNDKCQDVLRIHSTELAPYCFMTKLERKCHEAFVDRRVRGEYFAITFEEAVAELDSHAEEIAAALHAADQQFLDRINYYYNEFLPKLQDEITAYEPDSVVCNLSVTYALKMLDGLVLIGTTQNLNETIWLLSQQYKLDIVDFHSTPFVYDENARRIEKTMHKKYAQVKVKGEFFRADFEEVSEELDRLANVEIDLYEEEIIEADYQREKLLVELLNTRLDSPLKEEVFKETANLLLGRKMF